uniref:Uncharacterized protein n=1 Tax=Anas zonorhyncha TaxID=75864 RepID=A0A8B9V2W6_9AVES
ALRHHGEGEPSPTHTHGAPQTSPAPQGRTLWGRADHNTSPCPPPGISPTVKKTEMDKSPFNSPSPQDSSPRLSSFTQHHRPGLGAPGIARSPHPSSTLHFPTTSILPQTASTYFPHTAIRYPPHLNPQDPLKDLVSLASSSPGGRDAWCRG